MYHGTEHRSILPYKISDTRYHDRLSVHGTINVSWYHPLNVHGALRLDEYHDTVQVGTMVLSNFRFGQTENLRLPSPKLTQIEVPKISPKLNLYLNRGGTEDASRAWSQKKVDRLLK